MVASQKADDKDQYEPAFGMVTQAGRDDIGFRVVTSK
jgi:hypothetical protein